MIFTEYHYAPYLNNLNWCLVIHIRFSNFKHYKLYIIPIATPLDDSGTIPYIRDKNYRERPGQQRGPQSDYRKLIHRVHHVKLLLTPMSVGKGCPELCQAHESLILLDFAKL